MTIDFDLPEPPLRKAQDLQERLQHRWALYKSLFIFSAFYGALHKVVIPVFLSQTSVLFKEYTQVDFWVVPGILLAGYLLIRGKLDSFAALLCGVLIAYGAWETYAIFTGTHQGWLAWSHALSSLPQGLVALLLLTTQRTGTSLKFAWGGALLAASVIVFDGQHVNLVPLSPVIAKQALVDNPPSISAPDCGSEAFQILIRNVFPEKFVRLEECGFRPSAILVSKNDKIRLLRRDVDAVNIHFSFFDKNLVRRRQLNRILKPNEKKVFLDEIDFLPNEVAAVLYSDTRPRAGQVLFVRYPSELSPETILQLPKNRMLRSKGAP